MTAFLRHPSDAKLRHWLDTGEPDKVDAHLATCERCADRLEYLDGQASTPGTRPGPSIGDALATLFSLPGDLGERVLQGVERRSRTERDLALLTGLMGLAVETGKLVVVPEEPDQRQPPRHSGNRNSANHNSANHNSTNTEGKSE